MGRQRGFGILAYAVAAIVLLGMVGTGVYKVKQWGANEVRAEWAEANRKAAEEAAIRRTASELIARTSAAELAASQQKGRDYEAKWMAERAKVRNSTLAGCPGSLRSDAMGGQATLPLPLSGHSPVRFSWQFIRLWDRAWTGQAGEPVLPDPVAASGADAGSLSSIGAGEVLDSHAENAGRCSADRRSLNALIEQIERLRVGWK